MNKLAITALCVLVGGSAYFYVTDTKNIQQEIDRNPQLAPHATWRVQTPPMIAVEQMRIEKSYLEQVAAAENKKLDAHHFKTVTYTHVYHRYPGLN